MHGAQQHLWMHADSPQKLIWTHACAPMQTVQQLLCHGSYCKLILSLARTSCRLSFTTHPPAARGRARPPPPARPPAALLLPVTRRWSLQKSVQIHAGSWRSRRCGVAQASSDHPRWCRPHPVCLWVALALDERRLPVTEMLFFAIFARVLYQFRNKMFDPCWIDVPNGHTPRSMNVDDLDTRSWG